MTLPAFSPERAAAAERAGARLDALAGKRKTIDVSALAPLRIVAVERGYLGRGCFNSTGEKTVLIPQSPVVVRQGRVRVAVVRGYLDQWASFGELPSMIVSDRPGYGQLWHLDGLHRLVAARLLGDPLRAGIWR